MALKFFAALLFLALVKAQSDEVFLVFYYGYVRCKMEKLLVEIFKTKILMQNMIHKIS